MDGLIPALAALRLGPRHHHGLRAGELVEADACVMGSGASGGTVAAALVAAGWSVAMVEEGPLLPPHATQEEADAGAPMADVPDGAGGWTDRGWPWTTRNVGGGTLFYGGASFRYHPVDFDASAYLPGDGLDVRWPFGPERLAPWYDDMERRLHVPAPAAFPLDDPDAGEPAATIARAAVRLGYWPLATPVAIDRRRCTLQPRCIDHQCASGAKRDTIAVFLRELAQNPLFALYSGVRAVALDQERPDAVAALRCVSLDTAAVATVRARYFFLACNAIQSAALLLRSRTRYAPEGLGNRHDLVGRGLCMKLSAYATGSIARLAAPTGGPFSRVSLLDHYLDPACPTGLGGLIYESRSLPPDESADRVPLELETIIADRPSRANRVTLSPDRDHWGTPRLRLHYRADPIDLARLAWMTERCEDLLREAGAERIKSRRAESERGSTHLHGTCRAGTDPADSVVDPDGRVHGLTNLHIVDGGFMPFPGGLNPTLTIQANALRIARLVAGSAPVAAPPARRDRASADRERSAGQ